MANFVFNAGAAAMTSGGSTNIWAAGTIKARLVLASVTPGIDDTAMTGYTAATGSTDQTLSNKTKTTQGSAVNRIMFDNTADLTFSAVPGTQSIGYVIFYSFVTNDAGSTPFFKAEVTITTNGSDIVVTPNAAGVAYTQQ